MTESTRQRQAFDLYWALGGERSIERLRTSLGQRGRAPGLRTLYEWSRQHHWQDRIADLERQAREAANIARRKAIEDMYERQAEEALYLQQRGTEILASANLNEASFDAGVRAIVEGAKLERLARGEPGDSLQQEGSLIHATRDFSGFTDAELRRLVEIAERGAGGAGAA